MVLCDKSKLNRWYQWHPALIFSYFFGCIVLVMMNSNPWLLTVSLLVGMGNIACLKGKKHLIKEICHTIFFVILITIGNMLLSHKGEHVLFYVNQNRITGEAMLYGIFLGGLLETMYLWFFLFQLLCDQEKIIFLFGKTMPTIGLMISMTLHYIPMLKKRLQVIQQAQRGMGCDGSNWLERLRQRGKEYSILISWSLENAIETSDAMSAKGYGLKRRSCFHMYQFRGKDGMLLGAFSFFFLLAAILVFGKAYQIYFYPTFYYPQINGWDRLLYLGYGIYFLLPNMICGMGERYEYFRNKRS